MAIKNKNLLTNQLLHSVDLTSRNFDKDIIDSTLAINGIINLATVASGSVGDPGVVGKLFVTSSEAIGAPAGYEVICLSKG